MAFASRDLSEHRVVCLYVDGVAERLRAGRPREAVLAAWGIGEDGRKVLLHLMAGSKEDTETVRAFFQGHRQLDVHGREGASWSKLRQPGPCAISAPTSGGPALGYGHQVVDVTINMLKEEVVISSTQIILPYT